MHLGAFHALLAEHRSNLTVSKSEFIGRLLESAAIGVVYADQYDISCRHVFSQSPTRVPVSKVKARAILYQKAERFDHLVSYLADNISNLADLKVIIQNIIQTDGLRINQSLFTWQEPKYTDFLSYLEDVPDLSATQQTRICAAYLAEYFYYCLLWCQIDYALPGMDELHQSFHIDEQFYQELIDCFRFTERGSQEHNSDRQGYVCEPYILIKDGAYISVKKNNVEVKQLIVPAKLARTLFIKQAIFSDHYSFILSNEDLLIYHGDERLQMPYRMIHKPHSRKPDEFDTFEKMELLNQDGTEDSGVLIILANHYYLKITLSGLNWNSPDKMKKNGQTSPDYELYEIDTLPDNICSEIQMKSGIVTFHYISDDHIYAHKIDLISGICETSASLYQLRGEFKNHDAYISSDHRFVLLNTTNRTTGIETATRTAHAIMLDLNDHTRYIELLCPTPIEDDNYMQRLVKLQNSKSLIHCHFSKDNRFFGFSTTERLSDDTSDSRRTVTEIVDLLTMTRKKIEINGNDQCSFVGFINDQILVKLLLGTEPEVGYQQISLNALFPLQ